MMKSLWKFELAMYAVLMTIILILLIVNAIPSATPKELAVWSDSPPYCAMITGDGPYHRCDDEPTGYRRLDI
jgi:hypothetical protein